MNDPASISRSTTPRHRFFGRANGALIFIASLGVAIAGAIVLSNLAEAMRKDAGVAAEVPALARQVIENRTVLVLLLILPALIGLYAAVSSRFAGPLRIALLLLADLWIVAVFLLILWSFISFIAPMYEYQPL